MKFTPFITATRNVLSKGLIAVAILSTVALVAKDAAADVDPSLQVTGITTTKATAITDSTFENGWKWTFHVTVPNDETLVKIKLDDFVSGSSTLPVAGNVRLYSLQSVDAFDVAHAITLTASSTYSNDITLATSSDLSASTTGRQIDIAVEVRVPTGTEAGPYSTNYGVITSKVQDQTAPVITLVGTSELTVFLGSTYVDQGATATDAVDGNLTTSIVTTGNVDATTLGTYVITYNVSDSSGNSAVQVTRTVHVTNVPDTTAPTATVSYSSTGITTLNVVATINPSEPITVINNGGSLQYTFTNNGSFTFEFQDAAGNAGSKTATVSNIVIFTPVATSTNEGEIPDTIAPVITILPYTTTQTNNNVVVQATVNEGTLTTNSHTFINNGSFAFVATDLAGNVSTVTVAISNIDRVAPFVVLSGTSTQEITVNTPYVELGATASDNQDNSVTIVTNSSNVNTSVIGTYSVTYSATDAAGNTGSVTRAISVIPVVGPMHMITASAVGDGAISPSGLISVVEGTNRTFTITPSPSHQIRTLTIDGVVVKSSDDFNPVLTGTYVHTFTSVNTAHTISATFQTNDSDPRFSGFDRVLHDYQLLIIDQLPGWPRGEHTQESIDAFQRAIDTAVAIRANPSTTRAQITAAGMALLDAGDAFDDSTIR